jgi:predicted SpoU family rRNA methylase
LRGAACEGYSVEPLAALAVFLDWHLKHRAFGKTFVNGHLRIVPRVIKKKD